jgi:ribosome-binding protein aMBF1 (putative translation factor)
MADLKRPLDQHGLDALTLGTDAARAAYQEKRLTLEVGRTIRHARKKADLTQTELAARTGIDQGDLSRLETGQGVRGATIAIVERVAQALGREVVIQFVDPAKKRDRSQAAFDRTPLSVPHDGGGQG